MNESQLLAIIEEAAEEKVTKLNLAGEGSRVLFVATAVKKTD